VKNALAEEMDVENVRHRVRIASEVVAMRVLLYGEDRCEVMVASARNAKFTSVKVMDK